MIGEYYYFVLSFAVGSSIAFCCGIIVLFADRKRFLNVIYALLSFASASWCFGYFLISITASKDTAWFAEWWLHESAVLIAPLFLHFVITVTGNNVRYRYVTRFAYASTVVMFGIVCTPYFVVDVIPRFVFMFTPLGGPLFFLFALHFWWQTILAGWILLKKIGVTKDLERQQMQYIFFASVLGFIGGGGTFFYSFNINIPPYTIALFFLYPALITYAILKHRLFNAKVIITEVLVISLWMFILVRTLIAETWQDRIADGILLVITVFIGALLIRSVYREVEQREEIERLSNEKSEFMSFASHEIRNPITAMRGYASLIEDGTTGQVSAHAKDAAQKIQVNGDTVLSLISQFLNKSKLELGQIAYVDAPFDVGETMTSIVDGFKPHAEQRGLSLQTKIDFPHLMAKGDEAKVREVVGNLVDNSLKYTKQGGITVEVEKRNGMARIVVADTGVGIPPETLPNLFQKFSRADAQKMNLLGTGLGLYLAKTFIEGMGGKILAESDGKDKGSRFIIELHAV